MQTLTENGNTYIHRVTWEERADIIQLIKPVKTYDYVSLTPIQDHVIVEAIKASSVFCTYMTPGVLPGRMCIQTTPFASMTNNSIAKYIKDVLNKSFTLPDPDIEFPTLQEAISKYVYLYQLTEQFIIKDKDHLVYAMAYHMMSRLSSVYGTIMQYKLFCENNQNCIVRKFDEEIVDNMIVELKNMRADDGSRLYAISKAHIITIYTGMVPLNKADTLEVVLYDNISDSKFLIEFIVYKPKTDPIYVYTFFLRI